MKTHILGRTGFEVTEMGFGAWPIGGWGYGNVSEKEAQACIETYIELGGNHIDTARMYGESERIIGTILKGSKTRENLIIASKTWENESSGIKADIEETLRMLQTNYVDIYYLHSPPDDPSEMNRALDVLEQLKREGKIQSVGASIKGPNVMQQTVDLCRQYMASDRIDIIQLIYSIFRQKNREILQEAQEKGVGIIGRTALESGFLTGKYLPGHEFADDDHRRRWTGEHLQKILKCVQELKDVAVKPPYETLSQVALRFALDEEGMGSVIVGAKTVQQTRDNMDVLSLPPLGTELRNRLIGMYTGMDEQFNTSS